MLVKDWMSKTVLSADMNDSMQKAMSRLKENNISMLPVMKNGKLVGIVTDRDLKGPPHRMPIPLKSMNCFS